MKKKISYLLCFVVFVFTSVISVSASNKVYWNASILKEDGDVFETTLNRYDPTKIVFGDTSETIVNCDKSEDLSKAQDNSVRSCLVDDILYIQYKGTLYLNPDSRGVFADLKRLTKIEGLEKINTSEVEDMSWMFSGDISLIELDLSNFDTSNVVDMNSMFSKASSIKKLDLRHFNTSKVIDMGFMFEGMESLTDLDVSTFDTSNVEYMLYMFSLTSLTSLDLSNFNTSNVFHMSGMFDSTPLTYLDISNFDTSNVIYMSWMFARTNLETLDISNFDTSKLTQMSYMFYESAALENVYVSDKWTTSAVRNDQKESVFMGATSLVGESGTKYSDEFIDGTYARVDTKNNPGYFTLRKNPITNISLNETQVTLKVGNTIALKATINPTDTSDDKTITWVSSNPSIATVDINGVVTAKGIGTAIITAKVGTKEVNSFVTVTSEILGDVDNNGVFNVADIFKTLNSIVTNIHYGMNFEQIDINTNGCIDIIDIFYLLLYYINQK